MPKKKPGVSTPPTEEQFTIKPEILEELVQGPMSAEGFDSMFRQLKKSLLERVLNAELSHHLGYPKGDSPPQGQSNYRNGASRKTVITDEGPLRIEVPRDRAGTFEPQIVGKHERRFTGFDDKIIALYARGMSVRDIQKHLEEIYCVEVSPQLISDVTEAVMSEVIEWRNRALEPVYPVVFFDCLRVKIRDEGVVRNKAVYLALGILPDGTRDILGIWIEQTEGAKFWFKVFNEMKNRGVSDILIAVVDGLKGFPEAIETAFPLTTVQTCIVHLIRNSLDFVGWKDRKAVAAELKPIYAAPTQEAALDALESFEEGKWGRKHPLIATAWRRAWDRVIPFFVFPPEVRRVIYTTNAIESVHMQLRKAIKTRGHFPSDEAAMKLLWLALRNITADWGRASRDWRSALNQFAVLYPDRFKTVLG